MAENLSKILDKLYPVQQLAAKNKAELEIHKDGLVVWVCVDGVMAARVIANGFTPIDVIDRRKSLMEGE